MQLLARSYLFLSLHLLLPGGVDGVHHPLDGEVGDGAEYGEAEKEADDLVPAQRTGDVLGRDLPQHHRRTLQLLPHKHIGQSAGTTPEFQVLLQV